MNINRRNIDDRDAIINNSGRTPNGGFFFFLNKNNSNTILAH